MTKGILTTPVVDQIVEFLNEQTVRLQDQPGVEVISQWIEELPKLVPAELERCASIAEDAPGNGSRSAFEVARDIAAAIRSGQ